MDVSEKMTSKNAWSRCLGGVISVRDL